MHEDMEQSASPPETVAMYPGIHPWMHDAGHDSVTSAVHVLFSRASLDDSTGGATPRLFNNWCSNQLLLASHLITMQAWMNPRISGLDPSSINVNDLLHYAERGWENAPMSAKVDELSLEVLRDVRQNVSLAVQSLH